MRKEKRRGCRREKGRNGDEEETREERREKREGKRGEGKVKTRMKRK